MFVNKSRQYYCK